MRATGSCVALLIAGLAIAGGQRLHDARGTISRLKRVLAEKTPPEERLAARDALAKRQATAALALLARGDAQSFWPLLRHSPDPSLRSYLIRDIGKSGIDPDRLVRRLETETETSVRRALILCLGAFSHDRFPESKRSRLTVRLLQLYTDDPDAGVHSAIDWLLRHARQGYEDRAQGWNDDALLRAIDGELAGKPAAGRNWFVAKEGSTFSVLRGPVEFMMGSPPYEPGRPKGPEEAMHRVRIPRSFAVATKEVTVAQFQRFLDANPEIKRAAQASGARDPSRGGRMLSRSSPEDDCPQVSMTWFEAAQYCNWLSRQEGIPEAEWCYPPLDRIREGMELPAGCLDRTGYRLLTEAEWEFAARSGAVTSRSYGSSEELLREYAWYSGNTFDERSWPAGQLKPNDFGLFDMYGNAWEWCHDLAKPFPVSAGDSAREDTEDTPLTVSRDYPRPRRGGSFAYSAPYLRSAGRGFYIPDERRDNVGFRVGRTIR